MQDFPVQISFPIHWGEMDSLCHVNNARYFTWFESARIELFRRIKLLVEGAPEVGPILATTTCDFLQPVTWPGAVLVGTKISKVGNTSFTMEYAIERTDAPDVLVAKGSGVVVLVNYKTGEKVQISQEIRDALAALAAPA